MIAAGKGYQENLMRSFPAQTADGYVIYDVINSDGAVRLRRDADGKPLTFKTRREARAFLRKERLTSSSGASASKDAAG
jgi:hypothetical protein